MAASRIAAIPWYHSIAELAAFPLVSETALGGALTSLDPSLKEEETQRLWRDAEKEFVRATPSLSLDELVAMRDVLWFDRTGQGEENSQDKVPLANYLRNTARGFLRSRGVVAVPDFTRSVFYDAPSAHGANARSLWRWVSFALPPDLLLAALGTGGDGPEHVDTLTPSLTQQLRDEGYAETHLHLGAAIDFPLFWLAVLKALGDPGQKKLKDAFKSPGACLEEGALFADWLLRAAIARYLLGAFLGRENKTGKFSEFLKVVVQGKVLEAGHGLVSMACIQAALSDLYFGKLAAGGGGVASLAELQTIYAWMTSIRTRDLGDVLSQAWEVDPLAVFLPRSSGGRSPEAWLVSRGLEYLEQPAGSKDEVFERLFWQVLRVRGLLYRHVVQRPMTPGLQWFIRFFDRLDSARDFIHKPLQLESALRICGAGSGLRAIEARVGPKSSASMLQLIEAAEKLLQDHDNLSGSSPTGKSLDSNQRVPYGKNSEPKSLELSFIVHFSRDRGGGSRKGNPKAFGSDGHADPNAENNVARYRYSAFYNGKRREAVELGNLLVDSPLSLEWVRGVDLCADEMGIPIWVMAPLLRHARDASEVASRMLRRRLDMHVTPLRIAVHAGEDFVHLLTGLRLMDEAIEWLHLRPGDRIGHGLALGVEAARWANRAGRVAMPTEVRLFDLIWEWSWRSRHGGSLIRNRHLLIEREVAELTERIFGEPLSPLTVERLVQDLHNESLLRRAGFPNGPSPVGRGGAEHSELLIPFLTDRQVFSSGRELVWVDPSRDIEALDELQKALRRKVGENELVIEVNPSSNLLIGHMEDIKHHPLWHLHPQGDGDGAAPVALTIGSDDPITFATNLRQEYQLLYDTLILTDRSSNQADAWIEDVRKTGLTARFTVPWSGRTVRDLSVDHMGELERRKLQDPP